MGFFHVICYFVGLVIISAGVANLVASSPIGFICLGVGVILFVILDFFMCKYE